MVARAPTPWPMLYAAAVAFRDLGPWAWIDDSEVFGVEDPESHEVFWCVVLGSAGQVLGLAAYPGSEGLEIYRGIQAGKLGPDRDEIRFGFPCLLSTFEDRNGLEDVDLRRIKALGLSFRGRRAWPQFRSHRRGYYPWPLDDGEATILGEVLGQAEVVCARVRADPPIIRPRPTGELLVRVRSEDGQWNDDWRVPARAARARIPVPPVDKAAIAGALRSADLSDGSWEADLFYTSQPVVEGAGQRPYFPIAMAWMDEDNGLSLGLDLLPSAGEPDSRGSELPKKLVTLVKTLSRVPRVVKVPRSTLAAALRETVELLGCTVEVTKRLPALSEFKHELSRFAG